MLGQLWVNVRAKYAERMFNERDADAGEECDSRLELWQCSANGSAASERLLRYETGFRYSDIPFFQFSERSTMPFGAYKRREREARRVYKLMAKRHSESELRMPWPAHKASNVRESNVQTRESKDKEGPKPVCQS